MNKKNPLLIAVALIGALLSAVPPAQAAVDVGVSVQISEPGVYGRIDIGRFPQPQIIVQQPVVIVQPRQAPPQPVYMWVPPGHQKNWRKHCRRYSACGVPVYFVQDGWYREHVSQGPGRHDDRRGRGRGHDRDDRGERGERHGDDRGGHGHGRGKD
jgi:hypothetical protein